MNSGTPPRSSSQRANNVSPLRSPPPRRSSPPRRRRRSNSNAEGHKDKKRAKELAQQLDSAIPVMLDKLFSHLSSLPEEEMQERGGVTLPASALGWLSSQFYIGEESSAMWASTRDRLRLLRFLLPRVTHLRITRQPWPPPLPSQSKSTSSNSAQATTSRRRQPRRPPLETLQATSSSSVCSALTTDTSFPTRTAFLQFMELLADRPTLDLRLFPYLQVLVLDSVPPYWISNFGLISEQLKILRIDKACLYQLPALFDSGTHENLTHLRLNYCGIGEMSKLPNLLRKLPNLLFLNLAHNELMQERTALRGLAKLGNLTKLDLSGNSLTQLPHANFYLGNIQTLILTGNSITELKGIEKLYGLETLHIGNNEISNVIQMLGLARLPSLQRLSYQGNPFLAKKPPGYKSKKTSYKQDYRLLILSWFLSNRDRRREELPVLNHKLTSDEEWKSLQTMSSHRFITGSTNTTKIQRVKRTCKRVRKARIGLSPFDTKTNDISREAVPTKQLVASFSVQDVLTSLQQKKQTAFPEDYEKPVEEKTDSAFKEVRKDSSSQEGMAADDQHLANGLQKDDLKEKASVGSSSASLPSTIVLMDSDEQQGEAKKVESPAPVDTSMEQQLREAVTQLSMSLLIEPNNAATSGENPKGDPDGNGNANNITNGMLKDDTAIAEVVRINDDEAMKANEKDLKGSSKRTSVKLQTGGAQQPDLFGADWVSL
jgi:Leucine-rich repeat (LRR) protein